MSNSSPFSHDLKSFLFDPSLSPTEFANRLDSLAANCGATILVVQQREGTPTRAGLAHGQKQRTIESLHDYSQCVLTIMRVCDSHAEYLRKSDPMFASITGDSLFRTVMAMALELKPSCITSRVYE